MTTNQDLQELSVAQLFEQGHYTIPIYQRNYAWGEPEVEQLLQDVLDVATQPPASQQSTYYIGSLVVARRDDGTFETIDGQQRHTTLSIVLSALKQLNQNIGSISQINLGFASRVKSEQTLRNLFTDPNRDSDELEERAIRSAYQVAMRYLSREKADLAQFTDYLLNQVKILRVVVPVDTDLNHYFEIMNNRGEQLEKHEVLKARLMNQFKLKSDQSVFAKVWDACSEMNRYVQLGFDTTTRNKLFGNDWNTCPDNYEALCEALNVEHASDPQSLASIILTPKFHSSKQPKVTDGNSTFNSVINFSTFLLHVLRISTSKDIPLDDKRLLDTFSKHTPDAGMFALDLLKCRMLFDRYIIKRENDEDWSLKSLKLYERKQTTFGYVNSAEDDKQNQQLIMLLSMFHVSFPTLVYKHWLNAALRSLYIRFNSEKTITPGWYIKKLERISDRFFYGRFGMLKEQESIDYYRLTFKAVDDLPKEINQSHLNQGTGVQNFIFNRLDYLLWKRLREGEVFADVNMGYIKKRVKSFSFTFRTSVEHFFPQNPLVGERLIPSPIIPDGVDTFGNLCLICGSNNSKLSNHFPTAKKDYYENANTVESLKQVFMMSYSDWGLKSVQNIKDHEKMMIEVLCSV